MEQSTTLLKHIKEYIKSIDRKWLIMWLCFFVAFIVPDYFFKFIINSEDIFFPVNILHFSFILPVLINGEFILVSIIRYIGVGTCLIYVIKKRPDDKPLITAFVFTLISDTIFIFLPTSGMAVVTFCIAQIFHQTRFIKVKSKSFIIEIIILALIFNFGIFSPLPNIIVAAFIYTYLISSNIILSYRTNKKLRSLETVSSFAVAASAFAFIGFILFFLCDVNIASIFFIKTVSKNFFLERIISFASWSFYFPSQVLLANSSICKMSHEPRPYSSQK